MTARVVLTVVRGPLVGRTLAYEGRDTCLIGRGEKCNLVLPDDADHRKVSRHHCLLDINPPDVRLRDLDSRNGTRVDDRVVGPRLPARPGEVAGECELGDGDEIHLGATVLRVGVELPAVCEGCECDVPDDQRSAWDAGDGTYRCPACRARRGPPTVPFRRCIHCGAEVPAGAGEAVCEGCRESPFGNVVRTAARQTPTVPGHVIERELGRGGMGVVYLAREEASGQPVAVKVMLPTLAVNARARSLFAREMRAIRRLEHPHIVRLLAAGETAGLLYFTMEYCPGGTVRDLLKAVGPLPVGDAVALTLHALAGLEHGHNFRLPDQEDGPGPRGVVHRDLSPDNLFLTAPGPGRICKVGDYGLARVLDDAGLSSLTRTGTVGGKPDYVCRQQVLNYRHARPEVDVWALAACLYKMLTNHPPREFPPGRDRWTIVLEAAPVPVRRRRPDVPAALAEVLDAALADDRPLAFTSMAAFRAALRAAVEASHSA